MKDFKEFFYSASLPLGKTMYVYGGGWNKKDTGAGKEATSFGVSPKWERFFKKQNKDYDYRQHLYQIHNGLDCSGFVGFCLYNAIESKGSKESYVVKARDMGKHLCSKGFGTYIDKNYSQKLLPGDIMCSFNHVYIVLGTESDGSVLLIHSSPPGVQVNGTVCPHSQKPYSMAHTLACEFMKNNFPAWYEKYPSQIKQKEYLENYGHFSWYDSQNTAFYGVEKVRNLTCREVLRLLLHKF